MNTKNEVFQISASQTFALRSLVLRNRDVSIPCPFDGDLEITTRHFGVFQNDHIVCIASFYLSRNELVGSEDMIQLRGMATHPDKVGCGFGTTLVEHAILFYKNFGSTIIWCNAREVAIGFYAKLGFKFASKEFTIPEIGIHRVMFLKIQK